jgi:hypothetical protein
MTVFMHLLYQFLLLIGQAVNLFGGIVPAKYQPLVAFVLGFSQLGLALYNHYYNPDGTSAKVAYIAKVVILCLLISGVAMAQTTPPAQIVSQPWSLNTNVLSLPGNHQTIAASDSGLAFTPTPNLDIYDRNLISTDGVLKVFSGGVNYRLAWLNKKIDNISPNVNFLRVQLFVTAGAGIDQVSLAGVTKNHYAFTAGGGANYMLNTSGSWTLGGSVEWAKFPGYQNNGLIVKFGPTFHF